MIWRRLLCAVFGHRWARSLSRVNRYCRRCGERRLP